MFRQKCLPKQYFVIKRLWCPASIPRTFSLYTTQITCPIIAFFSRVTCIKLSPFVRGNKRVYMIWPADLLEHPGKVVTRQHFHDSLYPTRRSHKPHQHRYHTDEFGALKSLRYVLHAHTDHPHHSSSLEAKDTTRPTFVFGNSLKNSDLFMQVTDKAFDVGSV